MPESSAAIAPEEKIRTFINRNPLNYPGAHRDADEARAALEELIAERDHYEREAEAWRRGVLELTKRGDDARA